MRQIEGKRVGSANAFVFSVQRGESFFRRLICIAPLHPQGQSIEADQGVSCPIAYRTLGSKCSGDSATYLIRTVPINTE